MNARHTHGAPALSACTTRTMSRFVTIGRHAISAALLLAAVPAGSAQVCRIWLPEAPPNRPAARAGYAMAYDAGAARTLLWGGVGATPYGDTWSWDGENWTAHAASGPLPRAGYQMAYDSTRQKMVLTGNPSGAPAMNTWEWDGSNWNLTTAGGPLGRSGHALAFDVERGVMVLFGGRLEVEEGFVLADDTWEYDGGQWLQRTPATTSPAVRNGASAAYDAARGITVLYGGFSTEGESSETWEWDGFDWRLAASSGPPPTQFGRVVFDGAAQRVLLFTGGPGQPGDSRTWTWDGTTWTPLSSPDSLGYVYAFALAHDSGRGATVLFGGQIVDGEESHPNAETWELHICAPPVLRADTNCDGSVDFFDIDPFLLALFDPLGYVTAFPNCDLASADIDGDTNVNFFDIDPFLVCLFAGGCP